MQTSSKLPRLSAALIALGAMTAIARAADPGIQFAGFSQVNDQRPGSVLIYNLYASSATDPAAQNTRINLTNANSFTFLNNYVHLFFVDGQTCSVADAFICLTPNQTVSFLASDLDPGVTGFLIAVETNSIGCPFGFNSLIGDEYVKLSTGHSANLAAEAVTARFLIYTPCDPDTFLATLFFDEEGFGDNYDPLPRVLAADNIPSPADGNDTLLVINRIGGNLGTSSSPLGSMFGILYDDAERASSFTFSTSRCQFISSLSNNFPRTAPRVGKLIPSGASGWMKIWANADDTAILGAMINFNPSAGDSRSAYNGGHNLHKLRLNGFGAGTFSAPHLTIPVFPPSC
jgi:hypothetical protein